MKTTKKTTIKKEDAFRFATVIFMIVALSSIIAALIFFESNDTYLGGLMIGFGLGMLGVTLWSYVSPFYPILVGLVLYLSLIALLFYSYPDQMLHGQGQTLHRYFVIAGAVIIYALVMGYKEWKAKKTPAPIDGDY